MIPLIILISTIGIAIIIALLVILDKLSKKPEIPDINITLKTPSEEVRSSIDDTSGEDKFKWKLNPMDYINKSKTEAHINWDD